MEHESFVPTPAARLAAALRTPGAVASALPGWQPDPDAPPAGRTAQGRLRLRIAGSTITYRGSVTVEGDASPFTLEAHGEEVRGGGSVRASVRITLSGTELPEPGTTVAYDGSAEFDGRLASYDPAVVEAAVRRLLDRFSAEVAAQAPAGSATGTDAPAGTEASREPEPEDGAGTATPEDTADRPDSANPQDPQEPQERPGP